LAGIFLHQLLATLILVDGTQFRHDLSSRLSCLSLSPSEERAGERGSPVDPNLSDFIEEEGSSPLPTLSPEGARA
jgi:hypothetical protein